MSIQASKHELLKKLVGGLKSKFGYHKMPNGTQMKNSEHSGKGGPGDANMPGQAFTGPGSGGTTGFGTGVKPAPTNITPPPSAPVRTNAQLTTGLNAASDRQAAALKSGGPANAVDDKNLKYAEQNKWKLGQQYTAPPNQQIGINAANARVKAGTASDKDRANLAGLSKKPWSPNDNSSDPATRKPKVRAINPNPVRILGNSASQSNNGAPASQNPNNQGNMQPKTPGSY